MEGSNPTRHVLIALALTAAIFIMAGETASAKLRAIVPVRSVRKGE